MKKIPRFAKNFMLAAISMGFVDQVLTRRSSNESLEQEKILYVVLGGYSKSKQSKANQRDKIQRQIEANTDPRVLNIFIFRKNSRALWSVSVQYLITSPFVKQIQPTSAKWQPHGAPFTPKGGNTKTSMPHSVAPGIVMVILGPFFTPPTRHFQIPF